MEEEVKNPEAVLAELRRAQEDLKALRAEVQSLTTERDSLASKVESSKDDVFRARALAAETKLALNAQGIKDTDRLMKYVGTDGIDFDDEGNVTGIDERLKALRADLPELFDVKRRVGGKADIHANDAVEAKQDPLRAAVHAAVNGG